MVANPKPSDHDQLVALNNDYIHSVQHSDAKRFDEILAPDFLNSNPDGTLSTRAEFLAFIAKPATLRNLAIEDVRIRILGDFAIIHARTVYTKPDGQPAKGRYTDMWSKRSGSWLCVAAHVTRG